MPDVNEAAIDAIRFRFSALPRETLVALVAAYLKAADENAGGSGRSSAV